MNKKCLAHLLVGGVFGFFFLLALSLSPGIVFAQGTDTPAPSSTNSPTSKSSPTPTSTPTVTQTATLSIEERVTRLESKVALPQKDGWDVFKIVTDCLVGLVIGGGVAAFGIWATRSFNQRQLEEEKIRAEKELKSEEARAKNQLASEEQRAKDQKQLQEIQIIQSFMPQLQSKDARTVEAALLAITSLGNEKLATRLAELYRNEGSLAALNKMAGSGNQAVAEAAERSLGEIYKKAIKSIVKIARNDEIVGVGFFVRSDGCIVTTQNNISGAGEINVVIDQKKLIAKVVIASEEDNLALIKVDGSGFPVLEIPGRNVQPEILEDVTLIGYDKRIGISVSVGEYVGESSQEQYERSPLLSINATTPRSYGGSAVFSQKGKLLGMVVLLWLDRPDLATTIYVLPATSLAKFVSESLPD